MSEGYLLRQLSINLDYLWRRMKSVGYFDIEYTYKNPAKNLSANADSRTNTILEKLSDYYFFN